MKTHHLTATLTLLLCVQGAGAQDSLPSGDRSIRFCKPDAEVKEILQAAKAEEPGHIKAPAFVLKTSDNKFLMTIGGEINPILGWDIGNDLYEQPGAGISFVTSAIPVPARRDHKADFYINPINAFLDLQVVAFANTPDQLTGYVKAGTNGVNSQLMLQRAWISYRNFTAGMKLTLFQDGYACQPPTIDPEGPSGCISTVAYEVGYTSRSYNGFRFAAALDIPSYYTSNGYYRGKDYRKYDDTKVLTTDVAQLCPDIPVWVEYSWSQWNRIRLSGIYRHISYRDLISDRLRGSSGWGVMLSGNVQPAKPVILYYQLAYGEGIGAYLQDIAGKPLSWIPSDNEPGHLKPTPMLGANLGITVNATDRLQFNAMFSESRIRDVDGYAKALPDDENYKYALYGAVNCFYNFTSYLQLGVEYIWGHRQTWNKGGANDNRIQTQLAFTF